MYWTERHILACTGNHCNQKGAARVITRLRFELMRRKMNDRIMMNTCGTIDLCDIGPNLVIYPDNIVYSNVTEHDIPDIVRFLDGGPVVERLLTGPVAGVGLVLILALVAELRLRPRHDRGGVHALCPPGE